MDDATAARLNQINQAFYRVTAEDFDQTRGHPWPGWLTLWEHMRAVLPEARLRDLAVCDVGCGNGRLGVFLAAQLAGALPGSRLSYHGLDTDALLLARARDALSENSVIAALTLDSRDIVQHPPDSGAYDLVALFGVMHHIPGYDRRQAVLRALAGRVAPGGVLAFACWRFYEFERFRKRIVPWPAELADRVEAGDYLLDWRRGTHALRYCHHVDDAEHAALVAAAGLPVLATYRADGRSGTANLYTLLQRA